MTGSWERICRTDDVPAGRPIGRVVPVGGTAGGDAGGDAGGNVGEDVRVCVVKRGNCDYVALLDRCPHRDIALSGGIVRDGTLTCPGHFWRFDLRTGARTDAPDFHATVYSTRVVDGWVEAQIPPPVQRLPMREWLLAEANRRSASVEIAASSEIGRSVRVDGVDTNYHDVGSGPPVVLIHGSGPGVSAWANWRLTLPALGEQHRVLAPDVLGFGYTQRPAGVRYDLDTWARHLIGFLDAVGIERASVVGNSFGGALALRLASAHPDRVDKLVLMGSVGVPFAITPGLDAVWGFQPSLPAMRSLLDIFAHDRSLVSDELAQLRLTAATRPGVQEAFASMFPAPRQGGVDALTIDDDSIRTIAASTLVIHGRDDEVIPLANSMRLLELIERSQLHVFGQCGHWVQIEKVAQFNQLVANFLA